MHSVEPNLVHAVEVPTAGLEGQKHNENNVVCIGARTTSGSSSVHIFLIDEEIQLMLCQLTSMLDMLTVCH